jgi:hypothetical protein
MLRFVPLCRICGVVVSIPASGVVDQGFMPVCIWNFQQSQCLNLRKTYSTQHT